MSGSVSEIFANLGEEALNKYVRAINPNFNKQIVLINLSTGGYKEPQQLFNLEYALLSGFEFDGVLNMDGFNDLALASENMEHGINPIFPSSLHMELMSVVARPTLDAPTVDRFALIYENYRSDVNHTLVKDGWCWWYRKYAPGDAELE